ncbi:MAG: TPM domain-containing protein [Clostridia bacterium]|nr:TPM domain-containing protein [Clostridia bacterium]MDD4387456.1 TPM domain-containing protein [Clostridia bacterium]
MRKISVLALFLLFLTTNLANVQAADIEYKPTAQFFVNDFANILSDETEQEIFNIGLNIQEKTTAQLVIVTVPNMSGNFIESFTNELFNEWGIGAKEKNNGVLVIIAQEEKKIRIEVGYGLEGALNDAKVGRILDKYAVIPLKENNYDQAIIDSAKQIQGEIYTEYSIDNTVENPNFVPIDNSITIDTKYIIIAIIIFIFLVIVTKGRIFEVLFWLFMIFGRGGGRRWLFRWRRWLFRWRRWLFGRRWLF